MWLKVELEDLHRPSMSQVMSNSGSKIASFALPAMEFGLFAMRLGAGRAVKSGPLDYEIRELCLTKSGKARQKRGTHCPYFHEE